MLAVVIPKVTQNNLGGLILVMLSLGGGGTWKNEMAHDCMLFISFAMVSNQTMY